MKKRERTEISNDAMTDLVADNSFETTAIKLLQRFHLLQQERVETYSLFEEYVIYLFTVQKCKNCAPLCTVVIFKNGCT